MFSKILNLMGRNKYDRQNSVRLSDSKFKIAFWRRHDEICRTNMGLFVYYFDFLQSDPRKFWRTIYYAATEAKSVRHCFGQYFMMEPFKRHCQK